MRCTCWAGFACALRLPPASPLAVAMLALTFLIEQRLEMEVAEFTGPAQIKVLPPLCPLSVSSIDFSHADELKERATEKTGRWLDSDGPSLPAPERFLSDSSSLEPASLTPKQPKLCVRTALKATLTLKTT